nr:glycosyltransferase family 2 protein [Aminobacter sp. AP02]
MFVVLLISAPISQKLEPPANPGRFITVIVPVKNEEESIPHFLEQFAARVPGDIAHFGFLFVDDGSTDNTIDVLRRICLADSRVSYLKLTRNFGKEAAMTAGIDHVDCDAAIIMDVDLQDPPEVIPLLIEQWQNGYHTVFGLRAGRDADTVSKRVTAGLFYKAFNSASHLPIPSDAGDFRLISKKVIEALRLLPERNRFMKGLFAWPGYSAIGVPYERPARAKGETKFNAWKLWNFAIDGIASFSTVPLRIWTYFGMVVSVAALLYMLTIIGKTLLFGNDTPGYSSLMAAVLFFGGVQLISVGVLGEYIGRLYIEAKGRPTYLIEEDSRTT